ncbi:MAG TPA: hypothetical protein VKT72_06185 [Candidatus Baltobacteraceae bacterium]|nr:hypothetical protein [Candidatus Baltobacteraceae bacterium]
MMKKTIKSAAFAIAAALVVVAPSVSQAAVTQAQAPVHATYETSMVPVLHAFDGPWTGTLKLTFNPSGIIQGYYNPADQMAFIPVTGGRDGDNVWFDIGTNGRLHVNGTLQNGSIVGGAIDERTHETYDFTARNHR